MRLIRLQNDEGRIGRGFFGGSSRLTEPIGRPLGSRTSMRLSASPLGSVFSQSS